MLPKGNKKLSNQPDKCPKKRQAKEKTALNDHISRGTITG